MLDKSVADSVALTLGDAVATSEEDIAALLDDDIVIDSVIENVLLPLIDTEDEVDNEGFDEVFEGVRLAQTPIMLFHDST